MLSPRLASIVYCCLMAWFVYRDAKTTEGSAALWIPTIWLGIIASKPVVYWFVGGTGAGMDLDDFLEGDPVDRNILLGLIISGVMILIARGRGLEFVVRNKALVIFYLYLALATIWSDYPFVAMKRYVRDVANIIMALVILTDPNPVHAIRRVFVRTAFVLIPWSVLLIKYYPLIGRYYSRWTWTTMYAGVTTNKNSLGQLVMASGLILLWSLLAFPRGKRTKLDLAGEGLVVGMCYWILNMANSATALMCLIIGVVVLLGCRLKWARANPVRLTLVTYIALVVSALMLWSDVTRGFIAGSVGRDPTLTTRTDIWNAVLQMKTNFLFGCGYMSVWLTDAGFKLGQKLEVPHAHNGYLETYLNIGMIGLLLLLGMLFSAIRNAAQQLHEGSPAGPLLLTFCVCGMIYNYSEVNFNTGNPLYFSLVLASVTYVTTNAKEKSAAAPARPTPVAIGVRRVGPSVALGRARPVASGELT